MSTGPVAERTRGPQPASRTCCPSTSLPLRGGFPAPPSSAPKRKRMPRIPAVCLPSSLSRVPFLLSSTQKGKCCGLEGEGPGLDFPNLARAPGEPMGGPVWFLWLLGATHSWRSTSLSRGWGVGGRRGRVSPPPRAPRLWHPGALMTCLPALCALRILQPPCGSPVALPNLTCQG